MILEGNSFKRLNILINNFSFYDSNEVNMIKFSIIICRLTHDVEIVDTKMKLNQKREGLNKLKKLVAKKDPKSMQVFGP